MSFEEPSEQRMTERKFLIKRDMEMKHNAEFKSSDIDGVLISKGYVIPHVLIYNLEPEDFHRFMIFTKTNAQNKGWVAFKMLMDIADAFTAGRKCAYVEENEKEIESDEKPTKLKVVKVCGGKEYPQELKHYE